MEKLLFNNLLDGTRKDIEANIRDLIDIVAFEAKHEDIKKELIRNIDGLFSLISLLHEDVEKLKERIAFLLKDEREDFVI